MDVDSISYVAAALTTLHFFAQAINKYISHEIKALHLTIYVQPLHQRRCHLGCV